MTPSLVIIPLLLCACAPGVTRSSSRKAPGDCRADPSPAPREATRRAHLSRRAPSPCGAPLSSACLYNTPLVRVWEKHCTIFRPMAQELFPGIAHKNGEAARSPKGARDLPYPCRVDPGRCGSTPWTGGPAAAPSRFSAAPRVGA